MSRIKDFLFISNNDSEIGAEEFAKPTAIASLLVGYHRNIITFPVKFFRIFKYFQRTELYANLTPLTQVLVDRYQYKASFPIKENFFK